MTKREVFMKLLDDYAKLVEENYGVGEEWHGATELGSMISKIKRNYDTASDETDVEASKHEKQSSNQKEEVTDDGTK